MRLTVVNPTIVPAFLRANLRALRFEEIKAVYGMFFLHDLDLDHYDIPEIDEVDSKEVHELMGHPERKSKSRRTAVHHSDSLAIVSPDFPLGPNPSWDQVTEMLATHPLRMIKPWTYPATAQVTQKASALFITFSTQFWYGLHQSFLGSEQRPQPQTLEAAMGCWSLQSLQTLLGSICVVGSKAEIQHTTSSNHDITFVQRRDIFFPEDRSWAASRQSVWNQFYLQGYLREYMDWINRYDEEDAHVRGLKLSLDTIFSNIQCLPLSVRPKGLKGRGKLWSADGLGVAFVANPAYYRLESLGHTGHTKKKPGRRIKASEAEIEAHLSAYNGDIGVDMVLKQRRQTAKVSRNAQNQRSKGLRMKAKRTREELSSSPEQIRKRHKSGMSSDDDASFEISGSSSDADRSSSEESK